MKFPNHAGLILAILVNISTFAWFYGGQSRQLRELQSRLDKVENDGTPLAKELNWKLIQHDKDIELMKVEIRTSTHAITEIKSDVRMVAEWVKQQKNNK